MSSNIVTIFTLRDGKELHLEPPEWYFEFNGDISIRTPHSTHVIYNKDANSHRPFTKDFIIDNYLSITPRETTESKLELNQISFKPFGGTETVFEVVATELAVEKYCEEFPAITIVESD